jgi:hypothetical protein
MWQAPNAAMNVMPIPHIRHTINIVLISERANQLDFELAPMHFERTCMLSSEHGSKVVTCT